jgi:hypothetical protein
MRAMAVEDLDRAIAAAEAELAELADRRTAVAGRLAALRQQRGSDTQEDLTPESAPADWPAVRKVELFRSLFRGREDVFAVRWEKRGERLRRLRAAVRE